MKSKEKCAVLAFVMFCVCTMVCSHAVECDTIGKFNEMLNTEGTDLELTKALDLSVPAEDEVADIFEEAPAEEAAAESKSGTVKHRRKVFSRSGPFMSRGPARRVVRGTARVTVRAVGKVAKAVVRPFKRVRERIRARRCCR